MTSVPFTVGFDLDMTLIDPRPGMVLAIDTLAEATGFAMDGEVFAANLGPPLDVMFREFGVPDEHIADLTARFRASYPEVVIPRTVALPGAGEAIDAVRALGGRVIIVTGKFARNAELHVAAFGWPVDAVIGTLWGPGKGDALREHGASVYVGDHVSDVMGAKAAGATAVGVTTGPCDEAGLREAGVDVLFARPDRVSRRGSPTVAGNAGVRRVRMWLGLTERVLGTPGARSSCSAIGCFWARQASRRGNGESGADRQGQVVRLG